MANVEPFRTRSKIVVCRNWTTTCVKRYKDGYFDFVYVDARHDYKGLCPPTHPPT